MPDIKLFLADVDGTLVTREKILTDRAIRAVRAMRDRGIKFAITSGRPPKGMAMLIGPLAIDTPIAGFNGGAWTKPDLSLIETKTLPRDVALQTIDIIEKNGLDVWVYNGNEWRVHDKDAPHVAREEWTVKFPPTIVSDIRANLDQVVKIVGIGDDLPRVEQAEKQAQETLGSHASAARSQPYYLDVTHPEANKGFVVDYLANHLGVAPDQMATIGDQPNDTLMFRKTKLSIAMGNASDEVKKKASETTDSSEDEGFAKAVERFILGEHHG